MKKTFLLGVSISAILSTTGANAAGYTCEELVEYTSCNPGYAFTYDEMSCSDGSRPDFVDGNYARSHNMVTDFGKVMDAIADKVLVNGVLIIMAYNRMIPVIVPVIIITRDTVVDSIKMVAGKKGNVVAASIAGKIKTIAMMVGLSLVFFSNLPFELVGLPLDKICVYGATILSLYSGIEYFIVNRKFFLEDK